MLTSHLNCRTSVARVKPRPTPMRPSTTAPKQTAAASHKFYNVRNARFSTSLSSLSLSSLSLSLSVCVCLCVSLLLFFRLFIHSFSYVPKIHILLLPSPFQKIAGDIASGKGSTSVFVSRNPRTSESFKKKKKRK